MSLLEVTSLTRSFGGLMAVSNVDIRIEPGDILGMIGPNGAGKTTVFNLITGIYKPDKGSVVFDSKNLVGKRPHAIAAAGIARTFQTIRLFPALTVMENVMSAGTAGVAPVWLGLFSTCRRSALKSATSASRPSTTCGL